ncbi:hypothetical protein BVX94_03885 [bacterium B17]|nr:hypothetical protein BVX94_03885 [bacterium B17]
MNERMKMKQGHSEKPGDAMGRPDQLAVAFALMTMIPMLTLGYFLTSYVLPHSLNRESVMTIISLNTLLASMGFIILKQQIQQKNKELVKTNIKLQEQVLQLQSTRVKLIALSARLSETQEKERKDLAANLHDHIGGLLTMLGMDLSVIGDRLENDPDGMTRVNSAIEQTKSIAKHIRDVTFELRPTVLDDYGLQTALKVCCEHFTDHTSIPTTVLGDELEPRLPEAIETVFFRTLQEAFNNIAKHAQCSKVTVEIKEKDNEVSLIIEDDGKGFDTVKQDKAENYSSLGLIMMKERASTIGATLKIESEPSKGTKITTRVKRKKNA